jgi:predicted ATP-binding protein involved in virulence
MSGFAENIGFQVMYLKSLIIKNVRSFKEGYEISFCNNDIKPSQWTVILGNNNTGKTTILKCITDLYLKTSQVPAKSPVRSDIKSTTEDSLYSIDIRLNAIKLFNDGEGEYYLTFIYNIPNSEWGIIPDVWGIQKDNRNKIGVSVADVGGEFIFKKMFLQGYSTQRKISESSLSEQENVETVQSFFSNNFELINVEEWLLQINYASKNDDSPKADRERAKRIEKRVREVITSEILPDIQDFRFRSTSDFKNYIEFQTDYGWIRLKDLGYGYQATLAWVMDLAKRMFDRYPTSANPLAEPAVVLVDEIDLHLHPEWQRKIISYLSNIFKNTQFIVTAHSPLIIQSAENVNLVMLEKDGDHINIRQQFGSFKGWTVDEILDELMGMNDKTMSDTYLELMKNFDDALDEDNYEKAQAAYDGLDKILHPSSSQRKILRIQMSSLAPVEA